MSKHYSVAKMGSPRPFYQALRKYGDAMKWEVLADEPQCQLELNTAEMFYIARHGTKYPRGYNLTDGGEGLTGLKHSEGTKQKISMTQKGKKLSKGHKRKLSLAKKGQVFSEEHRRKLSIAGKKRWARA